MMDHMATLFLVFFQKYPNCSPEIQELVKEEVTKWLLEYWKTDGRCAHKALLTAIKNKSHMFFDIDQDGSYRFKIDNIHCVTVGGQHD